MAGGLGMLRGGAVLALGKCRCPGFQIHDRNFESESLKASQEGHPQENGRNASCYGYTKGQVLCFTLNPRMVTLPQVDADQQETVACFGDPMQGAHAG
jgi:hypothetical protein